MSGDDLTKVVDQVMYQTEVQTLSFCLSLLGSTATREGIQKTLTNRLQELQNNLDIKRQVQADAIRYNTTTNHKAILAESEQE